MISKKTWHGKQQGATGAVGTPIRSTRSIASPKDGLFPVSYQIGSAFGARQRRDRGDSRAPTMAGSRRSARHRLAVRPPRRVRRFERRSSTEFGRSGLFERRRRSICGRTNRREASAMTRVIWRFLILSSGICFFWCVYGEIAAVYRKTSQRRGKDEDH